MEKLSHGVNSDEVVIVPPAVDFRTLCARIRRTLRRQTGNGIQNLVVEVDEKSIRLYGYCSTYYCKQLAQQAAMRVYSAVPVENHIEVAV